MTKRTTKNLLLWIIAILLVTNVSTIGTVIYRVYFQENTTTYNTATQIDIPDGHLGRFFREELNLNYEQHQQFRTFRQKFHKKASLISNDMQINRNKLIAELGRKNSDTIYLHMLSKEIGNMHTDLKHLTFEYYLELKNVCTPEQKEKLFQIFSAMIKRKAEIRMPDTIHNKN